MLNQSGQARAQDYWNPKDSMATELGRAIVATADGEGAEARLRCFIPP